MSVLREMERLFLHTEHRVVSVFPVIKCSASVQARGRNKPPQPSGKPRVLCVTVQRRTKARGFKATLHICKGAPGQYEVRKSFRLKLITRLEAFNDALAPHPLLEITISQRGFTGGETRLAFEAPSSETRAEVLGVLYSFCRSHEKRTPVLIGLNRSDLGIYADLDDDEDEEERSGGEEESKMGDKDDNSTTPTADMRYRSSTVGDNTYLASEGDLLHTPEISHHHVSKQILDNNNLNNHNNLNNNRASGLPPRPKEASTRAGTSGLIGGFAAADAADASMWANRQDAQLAGLLDAVSGGGASLEDVRSRLETELAALDDANVHELLESGPAADRVLNEVSATLGFVDDLEDALGMFDAKLRHMREDMAAIEEWNNRLEARSRDNQRLLCTLDGLVTQLELSPTTEEVLRASNFSPANSGALVAAAWDLHRHLQALTADPQKSAPPETPPETSPPGTIAQPLQRMTAVRSRQRHMLDLAKSFLNRATDHLEVQLRGITESAMATVAALPSGERLRPLSHAAIHQRAQQLQPLLEVVVAMRPGAGAPMVAHYCKAMNALLKKEVGAAVKELLKKIAAAEAYTGLEAELSLKSVDSLKTLERIHSTPARQGAAPTLGKTPASAAPQSRSHSLMYNRRASESASNKDPGMPPQEAFELLVSSFFPMLALEVQECAALVGAGASPADQNAARQALLAGIQEYILSVLDAVKPSKALPCLSMIGTALHWQGRLVSRPGGGPVCDILKLCERKLRDLWQGYISERVSAIQKFDGTSAISGPGSVHVLPFIVNLEGVAARIEGAVAECTQREGTSSTTPPARAPAPAPLPPPTALLHPSPFESTAAATSNTSALGASPSTSQAAVVRSLADDLYKQVVGAMVNAVESHAGADAKHGPRLRMENYAFLRLSLQGLPLSHSPVLHRYCSEAASRRNEAVAAYVEQMAESAKLSPVLQLSAQLTGRAAGAADGGGATRAPLSSPDAKQVVSSAAVGLEKRLVSTRQRILKHLAGNSPYLVDVCWERLEVRCTRAWDLIETAGMDIQPKAIELKAMFAAAKRQAM